MTPFYFFFDGFGGGTPAPVQTVTPGFEPRKRRKVWTVKTPWGRVEEFDTAKAAYARYAELFEGKAPAKAKRKAKAKPVPPAIAPSIEYEGIDLGAAFARLARQYGQASQSRAIEQIAAALAAIEARARQEADERDDEEAVLLLLH